MEASTNVPASVTLSVLCEQYVLIRWYFCSWGSLNLRISRLPTNFIQCLPYRIIYSIYPTLKFSFGLICIWVKFVGGAQKAEKAETMRLTGVLTRFIELFLVYKNYMKMKRMFQQCGEETLVPNEPLLSHLPFLKRTPNYKMEIAY